MTAVGLGLAGFGILLVWAGFTDRGLLELLSRNSDSPPSVEPKDGLDGDPIPKIGKGGLDGPIPKVR